MADDFTTIAGIETVLADASDYDVERSTANCKRYITAIRRRLHFAASSGRDGQSITFNVQVLEKELARALAWLNANGTPTDAQRLANPDVTHADFSTLRGYRGGSS